MSYQNFKPTVWATTINRELERTAVFVEGTNRQYEGSISNVGDSVKILGVGKPTIADGDGSVVLNAAEDIADTSTTMIISKTSSFNFKIDDIDKRQAVGGVMDAEMKEAALGLSMKHDILVANLAKDATLAKKYTPTATAVTESNVLSLLDGAAGKLYENDVQMGTYIEAIVPVWFWTILKSAYIKLDTSNSDMMKNGKVGMYGNIAIKVSNNIAQDTNSNSLIQVRTQKAIAFVQAINHVEPYRPEGGFSDAVKGFSLYGAKIVRPKEMIVLNCHA